MAEQSGFFNSNIVNGEYDRVYLAESFAKYFASLVGNGVFSGTLGDLAVTQSPTSGMKIEVLPGMGWINGYWYENTNNLSFNIAVADGVLHRTDIVVLQWNRTLRSINVTIKKGTPASTPVAPTLQRDTDIYELKLAEISIKAGATNIIQTDIKDTRGDSSVCGYVTGLIKQIDGTEFNNKLNYFLKELAWRNAEEITDIVERLKLLVEDESALANLSLEVYDIESKTALMEQTLGYSKKNMIPYPYIHKSRVANGVTWTDLGDGTVKANGTATAGSYFSLYSGKPFSPGKYIVSSGADIKGKHYIYVSYTNKTTGENSTIGLGYDNIAFEITERDIEQNNIYINLYVVTDATASNTIFKPMLRRAEIIDSTWELYKPSVFEILQEDDIEKGCFYRINRFTNVKEWINPPCKPGIEYCTTERWNNNPVYQMTFYVASLPVNSVMSIGTNAQWNKVVSVSGYAHDKDDLTYYPFPLILNNKVVSSAVINKVESDGNVVITTSEDVSYMEAYITIKYTKQ